MQKYLRIEILDVDDHVLLTDEITLPGDWHNTNTQKMPKIRLSWVGVDTFGIVQATPAQVFPV